MSAGDPDRPPVRVGALDRRFARGDVRVRRRARGVAPPRPRPGVGQVVDSAIYEAVLAMMESTVPEYTEAGLIRERSGAILPKTAPSNVYPTRDGEHDRDGRQSGLRVPPAVRRRWSSRRSRDDPRFVDHVARGENQAELDERHRRVERRRSTRTRCSIDSNTRRAGGADLSAHRRCWPIRTLRRAASIVDVPHPTFENLKMQNVVPQYVGDAGQPCAGRARRSVRTTTRSTAGCSDSIAAAREATRPRRRHLTMLQRSTFMRAAHDRIRPHVHLHAGHDEPHDRCAGGRERDVQVRELPARRLPSRFAVRRTPCCHCPSTMPRAGVATHSSGNHGAALAIAAGIRGIPAYIVVPANAPRMKRAAIEGYGGIVTDCAPNVAARAAALNAVVARTGAHFVRAVRRRTHRRRTGERHTGIVGAGAGLEQIWVPVGGGGLASGAAVAVRAHRCTGTGCRRGTRRRGRRVPIARERPHRADGRSAHDGRRPADAARCDHLRDSVDARRDGRTRERSGNCLGDAAHCSSA